MPDQTIKCPKCGTEIPLNEAITGQIEQSIKLKYEAETVAKDKEIQAKLKEIKQQAKALEEKQQAIDEQVDQQVSEKLKAERKIIAEAEREKILDEQAEQTKALEGELEEKNLKLKEFQQQELELRKQQRKLQEEKEAFELEATRKLDEERKKITKEAGEKAAEEQMLKMREKENLIKAMQEQIESLKRKAETGSQEAQGEALEQQLQEYLESSFPYDKFEEVKKGARGADVLQIVHNSSGKECGKILWESKNTKDFQKTWIPKLKNDQQEAKADIAVIMSVAMPEEVATFGTYEGVWITDYKSITGLATALRQGLIEATRQKAITVGRDGVKDVIYNYITSREFTLHIQAMVTAYKQMKEDLESEKRSMSRIWSKREKQISTILDNITGMYGSIEGLVSNQKALPTIDTLSLESIVKDEEES
jgi:hypothetical protein